jgi:CO/xanthine dehydrogenase FAD-binding subunit
MFYPRRLPRFEYLAPRSIEEALFMLFQHGKEARVIAGGTDLLPQMKKRELAPRYLIGLKNIGGLDYIDYDPAQGLRVGPLATLHAVETSPTVNKRFPALAQAAYSMASAQIRNMGTVVGNICNGVPSADTAPALIVLAAKVKVASHRNGERVIPVEELFAGPSQTVLSHDELVLEVQVPDPVAHSGSAYVKHMQRSAMDLAIVGVAAAITAADGKCSDVRIALGAVAPTPIRAKKAEGILKGKAFAARSVERAAEAAAAESHPITDIRASLEYRRDMVMVLTRRALNQAWAGGKR